VSIPGHTPRDLTGRAKTSGQANTDGIAVGEKRSWLVRQRRVVSQRRLGPLAARTYPVDKRLRDPDMTNPRMPCWQVTGRAILPSSGCRVSWKGIAMTMPHSPGWYDDPDTSGAERYFNGQDWTPQRRRKPSTPSRRPQPDSQAPVAPPRPVAPDVSAYPYGAVPSAGAADPYGAVPPIAPAYPYGPHDPYASAYPYPAGPADPYRPSDPYGAGGPYGSVNPYGPVPAPGVAVPYDPFVPVGPPQQPPLARVKAGMAVGADRIIGLVTTGIGAALIVASFCPWGHVSAAGVLDVGVDGSMSLSFPGLGDPNLTIATSSGGTSVDGKVDSPALHALHNTNPGWIALALGIFAILAGVAYLWLRQRMIVAVAAAVLGGIAGVVCISHLLDVPGAFGDPPGLPNSSFSPGLGLVAACVLSFALAGVGITAAVFQWRAQYRNSGY
jgi:hypothetical protein